jgi:hypothetical protein
VAHRQHQVDLLSLGEIDADLKIWLSHIAEQIGPVSEAGAGFEAEGEYLFDAGQQLPGGADSRVTGHK